jgi:hypothetical protein
MFKRKQKPQVDETETPRPVKKKPSWLMISLFANIGVVVLIAAYFGGMAVIHESDTNPQFCATCHNMERYVDSYLTGTTLDAVHGEANVQCKDCHDYPLKAEIESGIKYVTGNYDKSMPRRKFGAEMCTQCHISMAYQANKTDHLVRNPHASHYPDMRCTNCHISHGEQVDYCSQCHDNGGQRMTGQAIVPRVERKSAH